MNAPSSHLQDNGLTNFIWSAALIEGLVAAGLKWVVAAPGSRSTPLVHALLKHPQIELIMHVDERSAAFFALGLARGSAEATALVITSGSALANAAPAVMEACHGQIPFLVISADRPPEMLGWGANQTADQIRYFGEQVRNTYHLSLPEPSTNHRVLHHLMARAVDDTQWPLPGPVHINIPFREPLVPSADFLTNTYPSPGPTIQAIKRFTPLLQPSAAAIDELVQQINRGNGLIICGPGHYEEGFSQAIGQLAEHLGSPILCDLLSGLRFGDDSPQLSAITHYDAFLRDPKFIATHHPDWVLRFGGIPLSRTVERYLNQIDKASITIISDHTPWSDPLHRAKLWVRGDSLAVCQALAARTSPEVFDEIARKNWWERWQNVEKECATQALRACQAPDSFHEGSIFQRIFAQLPQQADLFCGNSMAVRDCDSFSGTWQKDIRVFANRGVSGIDGNVSTALGIALTSGRPMWAIFGDLTFFHDQNGLLMAQELKARGINCCLILSNNQGGGIFHYLPEARLSDFERGWLTPTHLEFADCARQYGLNYTQVSNNEALQQALAAHRVNGGISLIEATIDRQRSVAVHQQYWQSCRRPG